MIAQPPVLVAPDAFGGELRAPVVAAAIARGLERAGVAPPPGLCPVAGGGPGTSEVLLPVLGGETGDGFALVEGGRTAIVERAATARATGERVAAAVDAGPEVVLVAAGGAVDFDGGDGVVEAIEDGGGLRGAGLVVLCELRAAWDQKAGELRRDPRGVPMTAAGGGLAGALWAHYDARLVAGAPFVLEELGFDVRMRAARAVIVGERRLDRATLEGRVAGEVATRARQAGVPCHAVVGENAIDRFDARILDLQGIVVASTLAEIEAAGATLASYL
ncbi:MAG: glycerate 2-kinase [Solirubrobacteraceae bacterium]|nr:glycerate 2-kinase [Solirubrobacteraceae bacterium]